MKNVYLITAGGTFVAFGVGMVVYGGAGRVNVANTNGASEWEAVLTHTKTPAMSEIIAMQWASAIASASDGDILRWDETKLEVTK